MISQRESMETKVKEFVAGTFILIKEKFQSSFIFRLHNYLAYELNSFNFYFTFKKIGFLLDQQINNVKGEHFLSFQHASREICQSKAINYLPFANAFRDTPLKRNTPKTLSCIEIRSSKLKQKAILK